MKLYFVFSKEYKYIVFTSIDKNEVSRYFENENLDFRFYGISESDNPVIEDYYKGKISLVDWRKFLESEVANV